MFNKKLAELRGNRGAVLLFAMVILTIIMFSTLALSGLLVTEVTSARYLDSSIVAHYSAESAAEQSLFLLKESKGLDEASLPYSYYLFFSKTGTLNRQLDTTYPEPSTMADKDRRFDIVSISTSSPEYVTYDLPIYSSAQIDVFDPTQETGIIDTKATQLNINWEVNACNGNDTLEVSAIGFQNVSGLQFSHPQKYYFICDCSGTGATPNQCNTSISKLSLSSSKFYHIAMRPITHGIKRLTVTTDNPAGLPSLVTIQTRGHYHNATQDITVTTPFNPAVSDIFQYVIFSEASIIKNVISPQQDSYKPLCGVCTNTTDGCSQYCSSGPCVKRQSTDTVQPVCYDTAGGETYADSGITQTNDGTCNAQCTGYTVCGDSKTQSPNGLGLVEQCDDGNTSNLDSCSNKCKNTVCGDGYVNSPNSLGYYELCDDGAANSNTVVGACRTDCSSRVTPGSNTPPCTKKCPPPPSGP